MVKTELTDKALRNAAGLVRESMLSSLREEEMPTHEFSEDFRESLLEEVRRNEGVSPPCSPPWWVSPFSSA